jgi:hypothetical protein
MSSPGHHLQDLSELHEVNSLFRFQRMLLEEGYDPFIQVIQTLHPIRHSLRVIPANHAAPKKMLERVKQLDVSCMLHNSEFRKDLKSGSHLRVWIDANEETTLAIHEPNYPLRFQSSRMWLNVKSLRVLHDGAFPADCPLVRQILTAAGYSSEY